MKIPLPNVDGTDPSLMAVFKFCDNKLSALKEGGSSSHVSSVGPQRSALQLGRSAPVKSSGGSYRRATTRNDST